MTTLKAIDLFAGAGGLSLGLDRAGINVIAAVEKDKDAVATLRYNKPKTKVIAQDIKHVDFREYTGIVDVVVGGFPCQPFSYAGAAGGFADTRGTLFFEFARAVKQIEPKVIVCENVRGLVTHDKGRTLATMIGELQQMGYKVDHRSLDAQLYAVPQRRIRVFVVGTLDDLPILYPDPLPTAPPTLQDALAGCPPSQGAKYSDAKAAVLQLVPAGGNWRDLPLDLQKSYMKKSFYNGGGNTGIARRLAWDRPAPTLTTSPNQKTTEQCHPDQTRPLNIREYARLQTFPDSWEFFGSVSSQYRQIGNAVPVNLAQHVGQAVNRIFATGS